MSKFPLTLAALGMAAILLVACGGSDAPTPTPASQVPPTLAVAASNTSAAEAKPASKGDAEKGKAAFATTCAACHGPNGEGVKGLGKDMTSSEFIAGLSDDELLAFVKVGRPINDPKNTTGVMMPPKGGNPALTDEQLLDIIAFIRTIHK